MKGQIMFEEIAKIPKHIDKTKYQKQKWRNKLQEYCDKESQTIGSQNGYCVCGYMKYCDYCEGAINKNACVKAICELANKKNIKIDYNNYDFETFLEKLEEL